MTLFFLKNSPSAKWETTSGFPFCFFRIIFSNCHIINLQTDRVTGGAVLIDNGVCPCYRDMRRYVFYLYCACNIIFRRENKNSKKENLKVFVNVSKSTSNLRGYVL